jgi:hypothetical protein
MRQDTILVEGQTYTKASALAKEFRYTTDYIGQLCRAGKVDCQLVGRSWYVAESSLLQHKDSRYKELRQDEKSIKINNISPQEGEVISVHSRLDKKLVRRLKEPLVYTSTERRGAFNSKYFIDEADLLPVTQKSSTEKKILPIIPTSPVVVEHSAKPATIRVRTDHKAVEKLEFTDVPAVSLRGQLSVKEVAINENRPAIVTEAHLPKNSHTPNTATRSLVSVPTQLISPAVQYESLEQKPQFTPNSIVLDEEDRGAIWLIPTAVILASVLFACLVTMVSWYDISVNSITSGSVFDWSSWRLLVGQISGLFY